MKPANVPRHKTEGTLAGFDLFKGLRSRFAMRDLRHSRLPVMVWSMMLCMISPLMAPGT